RLDAVLETDEQRVERSTAEQAQHGMEVTGNGVDGGGLGGDEDAIKRRHVGDAGDGIDRVGAGRSVDEAAHADAVMVNLRALFAIARDEGDAMALRKHRSE